jgi:hypothetical protein
VRVLILLGAVWLAPFGAAGGQESPSLAEQAVDPTASLMSFQFIDNYTPAIWGQDGTANALLFRAAVPFVAWRKPNIFRVSVPYASGGARGSGLQSVQLFDLVVFPAKWGRWGVGPLLSLQQDFRPDGPGPFGIGPAIGFTMRRGRWTLGLFSQNLFGDGLAASTLQPIVASATSDISTLLACLITLLLLGWPISGATGQSVRSGASTANPNSSVHRSAPAWSARLYCGFMNSRIGCPASVVTRPS